MGGKKSLHEEGSPHTRKLESGSAAWQLGGNIASFRIISQFCGSISLIEILHH